VSGAEWSIWRDAEMDGVLLLLFIGVILGFVLGVNLMLILHPIREEDGLRRVKRG
jgi:hypothetical protein